MRIKFVIHFLPIHRGYMRKVLYSSEFPNFSYRWKHSFWGPPKKEKVVFGVMSFSLAMLTLIRVLYVCDYTSGPKFYEILYVGTYLLRYLQIFFIFLNFLFLKVVYPQNSLKHRKKSKTHRIRINFIGF